MLEHREEVQLEATLTAQCGRRAAILPLQDGALRIVLEPSGDRGRLELIAAGSCRDWTLTDRGLIGLLFGLDLDVVVEMLADFDTAVTRRGDELVAHTEDRSLTEAVSAFVDNIEIVPVLAGLIANQQLAA